MIILAAVLEQPQTSELKAKKQTNKQKNYRTTENTLSQKTLGSC